MFAIAFDLVVAEAEKSHPKGFSQAYADIGQLLSQFGFERIQGSLYVTDNEDMANLFSCDDCASRDALVSHTRSRHSSISSGAMV